MRVFKTVTRLASHTIIDSHAFSSTLNLLKYFMGVANCRLRLAWPMLKTLIRVNCHKLTSWFGPGINKKITSASYFTKSRLDNSGNKNSFVSFSLILFEFFLNSGLFQNLQGICCWKEDLQRPRKSWNKSLPLTRRNTRMNRCTTRVLTARFNSWVTSEICLEPRRCCTGLLCPGMPGKWRRGLLFVFLLCVTN